MEYEALTREIIGAAMEVHGTLGPGFVEVIYQNALMHELRIRGFQIATEVDIKVVYKNLTVGRHRLDLLIDQKVVVELKAINIIGRVQFAQAISYLKATGIQVALIINFGEPALRWQRVFLSAKSA
jgi:GxxExxY protein